MIPCPHFIGIGAMRSATSWLNEQLGRHPELWMPPLKELHYFDTADEGGAKPSRRWEKDMPRLLRRAWKKKRLPNRWERRFLFGRESDEWYASLFHEAARSGKITGEITPAYAILSEDMIRRVRTLNPGIRVIFFMRDPIDRTWSAAMRSLCRNRGRKLGEVDAGEFLLKFENETTTLKSCYTTTMQRWESILPREQIFYGFFEEVQKNPVGLLERIFSFLGVDPRIAPDIVTQEVRNHAAAGTSIPPEFERLLARKYLEETATLARIFGGPTQHWHDRCLRIASTDS